MPRLPTSQHLRTLSTSGFWDLLLQLPVPAVGSGSLGQAYLLIAVTLVKYLVCEISVTHGSRAAGAWKQPKCFL